MRLLRRVVVWLGLAATPPDGFDPRPARERAAVFIGFRVPL